MVRPASLLLAASWLCAPSLARPWSNDTSPGVNGTRTPYNKTNSTRISQNKSSSTEASHNRLHDTETSQNNIGSTETSHGNIGSTETSHGNIGSTETSRPLRLLAADECKTVEIKSGDSCGALATRCGISPADFTKFNPAKGFCSALTPGARACCSKGELPDIRPKPKPDGTCASYTVKEGDNCAEIAAKNGLKQADIDEFNKVKTWGFDSCANLGYPINICLSKGDPPMPAPDSNALCGPTKPGTKPPDKSKNQTLADLSPCPLNACCNIWGQCGINGDFCVETKGKFGNPGTGPPGSNGCATNCGQDIVNNDEGPSQILSVGYYESWNMDRPCLNMKARSIANMGSSYTHMHWGFGTVSENLDVGVNDTYGQWGDFKRLKSSGIKTILSLGGWGDSTSPETYDILRNMVSPSGREHFTDSLAKFANDHGLSGVDIDWEYPGAPDIPGIPAGQKDDGKNYLAMLKLLRGKLDKSKTLSIAAPASYWYLKPFPIDEMAEYLDYIVYMTYDLHGKWDYGNKWAQPGCEKGNCLRSHVNLTETYDALSMITKAGVPSNKIVVGVSSYGRSFKMSNAGCRGAMCTYDGASTAKPGKCTKTGGYISNAEIDSIIKTGSVAKSWYDATVDADFLVYDSTEWVSYMKEGTKLSRASRWQNLNFAGTVDWAVDLQEFSEDDGCASGRCDDGDDGNGGLLYVGPDIYTDKKPVIECNPPCQLILPPFTLASPTTIKFPDMTTSLEVAWTETKKTTGTDGKVSTSSFISRVVQTTTLKIPPVTTTAIDLWNHNIPEESNETLLWLTWSIIPPPFTITNDPNPENKTGVTHSAVTRTIYPPPWPYSFKTPTTTPIPTVTHGTSTLHSSVHVATQTGKPGPKCTSNCGHKCITFCHTPCIPGFCPPGSLGGGDSDFWDPSDPNHPPGPPPGPPGAPPPAGGSGDACQPDVKMDTGLCSNGNYPIFDPVNMAVRCDVPADEIDDVMTECQRKIDKNLEESKADAGQSDTCCAVAKSNVLDTGSFQIAAAAKAKSCPINPDFRNNPPPQGQDYHSVFTCDYNVWPNLCANARSAILKRGKPSLLTYSTVAGGQDHVNKPWYDNKYRGKTPESKGKKDIGHGWALRGCEVEEYPFANGDPIRNPNIRQWDQQRVLRLIPGKENSEHGQEMKNFFREAGNGNTHNADGLIYSMKFVNHPTGTTDDDFFLGSDTSKNICAQPYGNAYILVNKADVAPGQRAWDPWWDDKLIKKTVRYYTNSKKTATSSDVAHIPSIYCHYPSPGNLEWDKDQKKWVNEVSPLPKQDRKLGNRYYACDNYSGYKGPDGLPPIAKKTKRGLLKDDTMITRDVDVDVDIDIDIDNYNDTLDIMSEKVKDLEVSTLAFPRPRYSRAFMPRAARGGSFLDPSAFLYLGCGQTEDIDPCADNDNCYVDTIDDGGVDDDGSWGPDVPGGNGGNGGGDDGGGDDGGGDDDGEPSGFDWGIKWSANECKQKDTSVTADQASKCSRVDVSSPNFQVTSAQGFTKPGYKACFYSSNDCTAKSDKDFASMSGGDRLKDDSKCVTLGSGQGIASYEVVKDDECSGAPGHLAKPDPSQNVKHCYGSGQKAGYGAIVAAAESFCRDVRDDDVQGPVWSNYELNGKKQPSKGYHFKLTFSVYKDCVWTANYDECMRYMRVPIDSCDCSAKANKQGGWVENNCIMAKIDANTGA